MVVFYIILNSVFALKKTPRRSLFYLREKGFEPPTFWFVAKHSIQLSYSRIPSFEVSLRQLNYTSTLFLKMQALFLFFRNFLSDAPGAPEKRGFRPAFPQDPSLSSRSHSHSRSRSRSRCPIRRSRK